LQNIKSIILTIADNGVGFDTCKKQNGIGICNTKNCTASYDGTAEFISKLGQGCLVRVIFPVKSLLLNNCLVLGTRG